MPQLQQAEWNYLQRLLEHTNPYTGLKYKDDPALAVVETHNEDSLFWHAPLNQLFRGDLPLHRNELEKQFGAWVKRSTGPRPR